MTTGNFERLLNQMRKSFIGYYRPTENEFTDLWNNCVFVLDANVLLNLYRYSEKTANKLFTILESINDRLWLPNQSALEYHRNRLEVIRQQSTKYGDLQKDLRDFHNKIISILEPIKKKHPILKVDPWIESFNSLFNEIDNEISDMKSRHPYYSSSDPICDQITILFEDKVGAPYSPDQLEEIYKLGKSRYENNIPPGYADTKNKKDEKKYGDLIVWLQIIDQAKMIKRPVIFITDEKKEDYWRKDHSDRIIGPRPELVEEINREAEVLFYMYQTEQFMEYAIKYLGIHDKETADAIEEVRNIKTNEEYPSIDEIIKKLSLDSNKLSVCFYVGSRIMNINGQNIVMESAPYLKNGNMFVPIRSLADGLGASAHWHAATQTILITKSDKTLILVVGSNIVRINGIDVIMDSVPEISNGIIMLPARYIAEGLGYRVAWNERLQQLVIY